MGTPRDYYADLELSPNADIQEIKKQFRKLALKYHPDRNPGREQEVNSQFQIIQTAHEVLADPQQKARYDASFSRTSRYPTASGVKGNPWQNVSQQFPTPPRRNHQPNRTAQSGAQRWNTRFAAGVSPTAKQQATADSETKKNAWQAFENMRNRQTRPPTAKETRRDPQPAAPPPPPPRSETARQRQQASFGNKKSGFHPHSSAPGDEPSVDNRNYFSKPSTERPRTGESDARQARPVPIPDPLGQFREREREPYADSRQSTPYTQHGGEKLNPFDGIPLGRAKSTRETSRPTASEPFNDGSSSPATKPRSSSVPRQKTKDEQANPEPTKPKTDLPASGRKNYGGSAAGKPSDNETPIKGAGNTASGPSMYAQPPANMGPPETYSPLYGRLYSQMATAHQQPHPAHNVTNSPQSPNDPAQITSPSGDPITSVTLTAFEMEQYELLDFLITKINAKAPSDGKEPQSSVPNSASVPKPANEIPAHSFSFPIEEDTFHQTSPDMRKFTRSSVDDINTQFVNGESAPAWKFSAGGAEAGGSPASRSPVGSRTGRRSPPKRPSVPQPTDSANNADDASTAAPAAATTEAPENKFDAQGWSDKFGPHTFVPQPTPSNPLSPTRNGRANSKKTKAPKATGAFQVPGDGSSDEETYAWRGRKSQPSADVADSPQAMDIDSPMNEPADEQPETPQAARNINVEPSRPDWRSGDVTTKDVNGIAKPDEAVKAQFHANAVGSEDSEEFRANFDDLKKVEPLAREASGLKSMDGLKDNLPFDSQSSGVGPIKLPKAQPLVFPSAPLAPRLPPVVAVNGLKPNMASWEKYLKEFEAYLQQWDAFNRLVVDHFMTRKLHIAQTRDSKGYGFLGTRGDNDVREYYNWVQQDNEVRRKWAEACEDHEKRFREFMAFRERMK